jgi:hypothetical protein
LHYGQSGNEGLSVRNAKIRYIKENPDLYTGFIVGGSRTGVLDPKKISEFTGLSFYNMSVPKGYMEDYEKIVDFLLKNTNVKKIILQLNGQEIQGVKSEYQQLYVLDSKLSSKINELKTFLLSDCTTNLKNFILSKSFADAKIKQNGMFEYIENQNFAERENLEFVDKKIIPIFQQKYSNIFVEKSENILSDAELVFESLSIIKRKCKLYNIDLIVIMAPTSIRALSEIESPLYWEYLKNLALINDFYNFNGFSEFNLNPYNFVDDGHYRREMADKMLHIIFNKERLYDEDWGLLITPEDIDEYIKRRKEAYFKLKVKYEETGEAPLGTLGDPSFIPLE